MSDDSAAVAGFAMLLLLLSLFCLWGIFFAIGSDDKKDRIKTYQDQLNTYILCVQKSTDKSVCGKQPDVKNYLN